MSQFASGSHHGEALNFGIPRFNMPSGIEVLLRCALYPQIISFESYSLGINMPYVLMTGLQVMGRCLQHVYLTTIYSSFLSNSYMDLHSSFQLLWTQE